MGRTSAGDRGHWAGKNDARFRYYRYYTWETDAGISIYQVQVYFTSGRTGFIVGGSTANDPGRLARDLPIIARIVESFRVTQPLPAPTT